MRVFLSAGEASGDALGASLIRALRARDPSVDVFGMGGPRMAAEGMRMLRSSSELNVMGLFEVLRHLPRLFRLRDQLAEAALREQPDVAVLIDAPDFNVRLAEKLKPAGVRVVGYVAPTVWAWRPGRVKRWKRAMDRLLVLFPFELPIWEAAGVDVVCVGHPLLDEVPRALAVTGDEARGVVALLPGSRRSEIQRHLQIMLAAARQLLAQGVARRFVLPVAPTLERDFVAGFVERAGLTDSVELVEDRDGEKRRAAIGSAEVALVVSGTATLETALVGRPQVIFYRVNWLSYLVGRWLMRVPFFGLPNIIAGRAIAPELLQGRVTAAALTAEAGRLLSDPGARAHAQDDLQQMRSRMGPPGAAERAAEAVLEVARR